MSEKEYVSISIAGIDKVQNGMADSDNLTFFQEMVRNHLDLSNKLGFWYDSINETKGEILNIREVTYDLLQHVLDEFVEFDSSVETIKKEGE